MAEPDAARPGRPRTWHHPAAAIALAVTLVISGCSLLDEDQVAPPQGSLDGPVEQAFAAYEACQASPTSFTVYLVVGATSEQVDRAASALSALPAVTSSRYLDIDETYREFQEFFSDEPEILELVEPAQLPTSFEIEVDTTDFATVDAPGLMAVDGVDVVEPSGGAEACVEEREAITQQCSSIDLDQQTTVLWVWLPGPAGESTDLPADVQAVLDRSAIVVSTTYQSTEESVAAVTDEAGFDAPEDLPAESPWSYLVAVGPDADRVEVDQLIDDLDAVAAVDAVGLGWDSTTDICTTTALAACMADRNSPTSPPGDTRAKVWLNPGVASADVQVIATNLEGRDEVAQYRYVDADATYAEFVDYFQDEPEILDLVDPEVLPTSFEIVLTPEASAAYPGGLDDYVASELEPLPGIDEVEILLCPELREDLEAICSAQYPLTFGGSRVQPVDDLCGLGLPATWGG